MATTVENDFMNELHFCIKEQDIIKGQALLQYFPIISAHIQSQALYEISIAPEIMAYPLLEYFATVKIEDTSVKNNLLDFILDKSLDNPKFIILFLDFAEDSQIEDAVPTLVNLLSIATRPRVLKRILFELGRLGDASCVNAIAEFIYYDDEHLKQEAIYALTHIGGPEAIQRLSMASRSSKNDSLIEEKLAELDATSRPQAPEAPSEKAVPFTTTPKASPLTKLTENLISSDLAARYSAIYQLIALGQKSIPAIEKLLSSNDPLTLVNALTVLERIADEAPVPMIQKRLVNPSLPLAIRFAAFEALSSTASHKPDLNFIGYLLEPHETIRFAAARLLNRFFDTDLIPALRAKIDTVGKESSDLVATLIDAKADNIFGALLLSDAFTHTAADYLTRYAHPSIREHYVALLKTRGSISLARTIERESQDRGTAKITVFVIEKSETLRLFYLKKLFQLGLEPMLFEMPSEAIKVLNIAPPQLILSGLNTPAMNLIRFTKEIRATYTSEELPIIMVTDQCDITAKDQTTSETKKMLLNAGIDHILPKPLEINKLKSIIKNIQEKVLTKQYLEQLNTPLIGVRHNAIVKLVGMGKKIIPETVNLLKSNTPDLMINALSILDAIGDSTPLPTIRTLLSTKPSHPIIRYAAYHAISRLPSSKITVSIIEGLEDRVELVRFAAARAVNNRISDVLVAGLRDKIDTGGNQSKNIIATLIDAKADNAFGVLLVSDAFTQGATDYLSYYASPYIRDFFLEQLNQRGSKLLARNILRDGRENQRPLNKTIFIVSDDEILGLYLIKILYRSGFNAILFDKALDATRALQKNKPDLVIAHLFNKDVSGFDLAVKLKNTLKRKHDTDILPFILLTDQDDFSGKSTPLSEEASHKNHDLLKRSGVSDLVPLPFADKEFIGRIQELTNK